MSPFRLRRTTTRVVVAIATMLFLLLPATVAAGTATAVIYNARQDFQASPNQANPSGPWSYRQSAGPGKPLLDEFWSDHAFVPGLETWHGQQVVSNERDKLPFVGVNTSGADQHPFGINWPAGALLVHPTESAVVIRWTSPMAGSIHVRAVVIDRDANCGEGVNYAIQLGRQPHIAKGTIANGGSARLRAGWYHVEQGSKLELRVGSGPDHAGCDSTQVNLEITLNP